MILYRSLYVSCWIWVNMWYQSKIEEILSIRSFIQQDSSRFFVCAIVFWVRTCLFDFLVFSLKLNRSTHLVFDSDHFLAFILIFGVKIMPGSAFFEYFRRSFVDQEPFPIGIPSGSPIWSLSATVPNPDREHECYSTQSWSRSDSRARVLQCLIPIPPDQTREPSYPLSGNIFIGNHASAIHSGKHVQYTFRIWYCTWKARQIYVSNPRFPRNSCYGAFYSKKSLMPFFT